MDTTVLITGIFSVIVAVIEALAASDRKKIREEQKRTEDRAALRAEESRLSMKMMHATMQLSVVSANALTNGHNNGNVERARAAAEQAEKEYDEFLRKAAAGVISNN